MPNRFKIFGTALCLVFVLCFAAPNSHADSTFDVSGTATNDSGGSLGSCASDASCSFSGTLTIDVTAGMLTGIDITFPGLLVFDQVIKDAATGVGWQISAGNLGGEDGLIIHFATEPTPGSFVGFTGGTELTGTVFLPADGSSLYNLTGGSITPATAAAPEPSSLALLLCGVGLLFAMRKLWA